MTRDELEEIKARAEAATPGPWEFRGKSSSIHSQHDRGEYSYGPSLAVFADDLEGIAQIEDNDLEFVLHARTDVPALVAEVERLRGIIERESRSRMAEDSRYEARRGEELLAELDGF